MLVLLSQAFTCFIRNIKGLKVAKSIFRASQLYVAMQQSRELNYLHASQFWPAPACNTLFQSSNCKITIASVLCQLNCKPITSGASSVIFRPGEGRMWEDKMVQGVFTEQHKTACNEQLPRQQSSPHSPESSFYTNPLVVLLTFTQPGHFLLQHIIACLLKQLATYNTYCLSTYKYVYTNLRQLQLKSLAITSSPDQLAKFVEMVNAAYFYSYSQVTSYSWGNSLMAASDNVEICILFLQF